MPDNQREKIRRLVQIRKQFSLTQAELASILGINRANLSAIENGRENRQLPNGTSYIIEKELNINPKWFENGEGEMIKAENVTPESNTILIGGVPGPDEFTEMTELGNNDFGMVIPKVPFKAWAGYVDNFGDMEYMESLPKYNVTITGATRGRYLAFVVDGDSMENYTTEELARSSIPSGTIVTGREIQRQHWRNKLHLHRFQNYVIVLTTGIITKQIIEHNTQEGYIICHSLNTKYQDFKLMLDDCVQILNIVRRELPE